MAVACGSSGQLVANPEALAALRGLGHGEQPSAPERLAYCELTAVPVRGEVVENFTTTMTVAITPASFTCTAVVERDDFRGREHTVATIKLRLEDPIPNMRLPAPDLVRTVYHPGAVADATACRLATELAATAATHDGRLTATVERRLIRQDWFPAPTAQHPTPPETHWLEEVTLTFDQAGGVLFNGAQLGIPRSYCGR